MWGSDKSMEQLSTVHASPRRLQSSWNATLAHLQLVAAYVVDDEDVERHGEEYDAGDADDLEGLGAEIFVDNISGKIA